MNHFGTRFLNEDGSWKNLMEQKNSTSDMACLASQFPRLVGLAQASKSIQKQQSISKVKTQVYRQRNRNCFCYNWKLFLC